jgi:hypothetical protein
LNISGVREESAWDLFRKPLFLVIGIADRHVEYSLLQALVFPIRMGLNHHGGPFFKSFRGQSWDIRSFMEISRLDQVVFHFHVAEQSRDGGGAVIKYVCINRSKKEFCIQVDSGKGRKPTFPRIVI